MTDFKDAIAAAYKADGPVIDLGRGVHGTRTDSQAARVEAAAAPPEATAPPKEAKAPAPKASTVEQVGDFLGSRQGKALQKQVMRGVFGMLKKRL